MAAFDPARPYNDLPPLPPEQELETKAVLKLCIEARAAVAELKQVGETLPNQAVLINTIPLLEAQASSEIENIVTTSDQLFRFATTSQADAATQEALRYRTALNRGFHALEKRPLCTAIAVQVCQTIKDTDLDIRRVPGTTLANPATGELIYTPPEGEALTAGQARQLGAIPARARWCSTRSFVWPLATTSSRPSIRSLTATAARGACSTSFTWSTRACSSSRCYIFRAISSATRPITIAC